MVRTSIFKANSAKLMSVVTSVTVSLGAASIVLSVGILMVCWAVWSLGSAVGAVACAVLGA